MTFIHFCAIISLILIGDQEMAKRAKGSLIAIADTDLCQGWVSVFAFWRSYDYYPFYGLSYDLLRAKRTTET